MHQLKIIIAVGILSLMFPLLSECQEIDSHNNLIEWMSLDEALEKQKTHPKKIFIDIYTDWCGWCKIMSKNTFSNKQIAQYINNYFYPVRFNAETKDTIEYLGKIYVNQHPKRRRPTHDIVNILTNNRASYPTITYLDEKGKLIQAIPGYMDVEKIQPFLIYFNENAFKSAPFETFKTNYDRTFKKPEKAKLNRIQWLSFEDAQKLAKSSPKPILIDIYADFSLTSKVMETTSFTDDSLINYINKNFYAVRFNPTQKDTIIFDGKTFVNKSGNYGFHELAIYLTNRKIGIPATIYLNDKLQLLSNIPGYRSPKELEPIMRFFGDQIYLSSNYQTFISNFKSSFYPEPKKEQ